MRHLATQPPNAICVFACFQVDILPRHHMPSFASSSLPLSVMTSCRLLDASVSCMICHHVDLKVSMMWFTCLQLFAATMLCLTSKQRAASISVLSRRPGQYNAFVCQATCWIANLAYFGNILPCDPFQNCTVPWWLDLMHSNSWLAACLMITVSWRVAWSLKRHSGQADGQKLSMSGYNKVTLPTSSISFLSVCWLFLLNRFKVSSKERLRPNFLITT